MKLPQFIFFTGVPGSRWSGIAREIKQDPQYDCTDRAPHRNYTHNGFAGHQEAYFGTGMEFPPLLDPVNLVAPFEGEGTKLLMSHEWPYYFEDIQDRYPDAWIQLVYRPDWESFLWWKQAGGWDITYPNYDWYENDVLMRERIAEQNKLILDFGQKHAVQWTQHYKHRDIFIATHK